jgi:hypothetical protein
MLTAMLYPEIVTKMVVWNIVGGPGIPPLMTGHCASAYTAFNPE